MWLRTTLLSGEAYKHLLASDPENGVQYKYQYKCKYKYKCINEAQSDFVCAETVMTTYILLLS